jgi:hypothetical protein
MDDDHAQFLITVCELCLAAQLAHLHVALVTSDGRHVVGIPAIRQTRDPLDDTGCPRTLRLGGTPIELDGVIECTLHAPVR